MKIPPRDKHNYITMGMLNNMYFMLVHMMSKTCNDQEILEITNKSREMARERLKELGYVKKEVESESGSIN